MKLVTTERPKGARIGLDDQREFALNITALANEFIEAQCDWAEVTGWQRYCHNANAASMAARYILSDFPQVRVHRVGERVYLRRRWADE